MEKRLKEINEIDALKQLQIEKGILKQQITDLKRKLNKIINMEKLEKEISVYRNFCNTFIEATESKKDIIPVKNLTNIFNNYLKDNGYNKIVNGQTIKKYIKVKPLNTYILEHYNSKRVRRNDENGSRAYLSCLKFKNLD
jgi:hypothetical protein